MSTMMATNESNGKQTQGPAFEMWMVANVAMGAGFSAFVTESTGNAADAGVVMAVISLAAGLAVLLILISLWPAERKKQAEEAAAIKAA